MLVRASSSPKAPHGDNNVCSYDDPLLRGAGLFAIVAVSTYHMHIGRALGLSALGGGAARLPGSLEAR